METPEDVRLAESHEWIRIAEDPAPVGISFYAQSELGELVFVELPEVGRVVEAKEVVAVVESVKTAGDIYSPVAGEIVEVNSAVEDDAAVVNKDPFGEGWLFKIKVKDGPEADELLDPTAYAKVVEDS